eukprot:8985819-Lingulodinium_polyedra.AAC.1
MTHTLGAHNPLLEHQGLAILPHGPHLGLPGLGSLQVELFHPPQEERVQAPIKGKVCNHNALAPMFSRNQDELLATGPDCIP